MKSFEINEDLLEALDEYDRKSMLLEKHVIEKVPFEGSLKDTVDDDLMFNVPIYDMGNRRYASFCSLTEALVKKEKDVKGNGVLFKDHKIDSLIDWAMCFYLFRLCGSGINYKPKIDESFLKTHGFGNFWIVDSILNGKYTWQEWKEDLIKLDKPFTDNKGYLLPQFTFDHIANGHLKFFIIHHAYELVSYIVNSTVDSLGISSKFEIFHVTNLGNDWLNERFFKRQNFVLTAFAADLAEYFPNLVDPNSRVYAGTNATKCIKAIFPKRKRVRVPEFDYINDVLEFQSKRYSLPPISCEDSRNCDLVRYFTEYQSQHHIDKNNGVIMKNNSILKKKWGLEKYYNFANNLK